MKAIRFHEFGGPEVLRYEDVPDPQPRKDEVLVRVKACAMNHLDLWVRKGLPGVKLPHINGSDVAGDVAAERVGEAPLVASDLIDALPEAYARLMAQWHDVVH